MEIRRNPKDLEGIYGKGGKESAAGGPGVASLAQRAAQSARPGAGAGNPPAQLAQPVAPEKDSEFLAMLKGREGSPAYMSHEKVSEGSNDALNRALIRGGAAMMANRDPAIGSGLQGFLQTAGKGATEGLTGYEQYLKEFKDRKIKQDEIAANDRYRTEANRIATANTGLNYEAEQKKAAALILAAERKERGDEKVATIMAGARNKTLEDAYLNEKDPKKKEKIEKMILSTTRGATTKDWGREQMLDTEKVFFTRLKNDVNLQSLTPKQLQIELVKHMREHGYSDYGSNVGGGGGGYQPTKEELSAFNKNQPQK